MGELDEMVQICADRDIPLVLVVFPIRNQLEEFPTPDEPQRRIREYAESRGVFAIDLLPGFLGRDAETLFFDYVHLTPVGNALAAELIGRYLMEKLPERLHGVAGPSH